MNRVWFFRIAVSVGCVAYGLVALGSGLDREAGRWPALAESVPAPFASKALEVRGLSAMLAGDGQTALGLGEAYVGSSPIEPTATALLGGARAMRGDAEGADAAYRVAGQMGWRVPLTQRYWMSRALAVGDYRIAAQRLDAMLRQQPGLLADRSLLDPMERDPDGQQALAERILAEPDWLSYYMLDYGNVPEDILLLRAQVLTRAAGLGAVGGCEGAAALSHRLVELGDARIAAQLWRDHCPQTGKEIVADGNFKRATLIETLTPFDWQFGAYSDVDISLEPVLGDGRVVSIITSAPYTRIVASQFLVLPAGRYRLSWRSEGHTARDTPMMLAALDCNAQSNDWLEAGRDARSGLWSADVTLSDACQGKWLNFAVRPGVEAGAGVRGGQVTLASVALTPLTQLTPPATQP